MNQMTKIKIIPDFLMLLIGVGGLILFTAIYLITGVADHALLALSLVCGFYGLITIFILGISFVHECTDELLGREKYD